MPAVAGSGAGLVGGALAAGVGHASTVRPDPSTWAGWENEAPATRAACSFTLDRYGHLYPESDAALRDRLDAIYSAGERDQGAALVELFGERLRPQRGLGTR